MTARPLPAWRLLAATAAVAAPLAVAAPAGAAEPLPPSPSVSLPAVPHPGDAAMAADQGMRLDRRSTVFEATGYQTLAVAGVAGGAALIASLSGGVPAGLTAGGAVVLIYLFMP